MGTPHCDELQGTIGQNAREPLAFRPATLTEVSVSYQLEGDVALITLDRPDQFNAINADLSAALRECLERAGTESRAVVLTGSGRAFCSGADLTMIGPDTDLGVLLDDVFHPALLSIIDSSVPIVAAINGVAAGAGLGLALACDLRIMAESGFLTSAFTAIGLAPDSGTTWWLSHHVGVSRALEITMTNRRVGATECADLGLCHEVVADERVVSAAVELAATLADMVPDSLVTTRKLVHGAAAMAFLDAIAAERDQQERLGMTPEHKEGVRAFLEKRKADFRSPST